MVRFGILDAPNLIISKIYLS